MLRLACIILGVAGLIGALVCLLLGIYWLALWLFIEGIVLTLGVLFERWRYIRKVDRTRGRWPSTGERFTDPTSGQLVEVFYNPETGERAYQEKSPPN